LKADVGRGLMRYVTTGPDGAPTCSEGNRCWTLDYPGEPFHMDVLPAIPDVEARPNGILLTDRDLREWQHSNPLGYAIWFRGRMAAEYAELREAAAVAKRMDVEDIPDWEVKTTLQRTVQALKRHRDIHFAQSPEDKPASIVITTLAAMAYRGQASLFEVLVDIVGRLPNLIEDRAGVLWIPNPVHPEENFADRWRAHPERAQRFFDWVDRAQQDFAGLGQERGLDRIVTKLAESLGSGPANRAGSAPLRPSGRRARTASSASVPARGCSAPHARAPCPGTPSTAMRRRLLGSSLAQQAFALRGSFPDAHVQLSPQQLVWRGTITPSPLSRDYTVRIAYRLGHFPKVRVVAPALERRPDDSIPHLFSDGSICLHLYDEWSADMLIVYTTIPWTSEWLFNYEIWLATGTWHGGGEWPPPRQANSTPTSKMARSERRRTRRPRSR
jgi:hypothetical protein